jgi:phosphate transport system permease protein
MGGLRLGAASSFFCCENGQADEFGMSGLLLAGCIAILALVGFWLGRNRAMALVDGNIRNLHSLPGYYGAYLALWCAVPALILVVIWSILDGAVIESLVIAGLPDGLAAQSLDQRSLFLSSVRNAVSGNIVSSPTPDILAAAEHYAALQSLSHWVLTAAGLALAAAGLMIARRMIVPTLRSRETVEKVIMVIMIAASGVAVLTTIGIVLSLLFEASRFFAIVPITDFLFGLDWSPQTAIRADQVGSSGAFGAVPVFAGTILVTIIAMVVAVPIGLFSAIYLSEYASASMRAVAKPLLEILAGIPTVVYGFFAALTIAPLIRGWGEGFSLDVSSESALAAGLVMGVMIIPFVSSLSDDAISAVPGALRDGSYALGATKSETITRVLLPAALPGIFGAVLLAVSRAIGETMIVVMAAGLAANLTANPFAAVTTVTVQIATILVGDQEFDSAKTLSAFALGLVLFCATLMLNIVALMVVRKYREKYD